MAAVGRIEEFTQTIIASGDIRRDQGVALLSGFALDNPETRLMSWRNGSELNRIDTCQRGRLRLQCLLETVKCLLRALDFDGDAIAIIQHKAHEVAQERLVINEWAKADALNDTLYKQSAPL